MTRQRAITERDIREIYFFWMEKNDPTRYCDWEAIQEDLMVKYPEIYTAYMSLKLSTITFDAVIKIAREALDI